MLSLGNTHGDVCALECRVGESLVGDRDLVCGPGNELNRSIGSLLIEVATDGNWKGHGVCVPHHCPPLVHSEHMTMECTGTGWLYCHFA